jgi:hypothetical protein
VCDAGLTACGDACLATSSDPLNCGSCGKKCDAGQVCSGGACGTTCATGLTNCGGACVSTDTSNSNCGGCGRRCGGGSVCVGGRCQDATVNPFCKTCPCPSCDVLCCASALPGAATICVDGSKCPTL